MAAWEVRRAEKQKMKHQQWQRIESAGSLPGPPLAICVYIVTDSFKKELDFTALNET